MISDDNLSSVGLPAPLAGDPRRQAVPSIRGTVYQAWHSIDAWLRLTDDETVIYLEGAEDFDVVAEESAITVQVRNTNQPLSLGVQKSLRMLEAFWLTTSNEPHRRVDLHYVTTSPIATEQDAQFGGLSGIAAWRIAQTDAEMAMSIGLYIAAKLDSQSQLGAFVRSSTAQEIQERLIKRFHWIVGQPDLEAVMRSVEDRITGMLAAQNRALSLVQSVSSALQAHFWKTITRPTANERCLTRGVLLRQIADATHVYLPIPLEHLPALAAAAAQGTGLLDMLLEKVPRPPSPLLDRPSLVESLCKLIQRRKVVLITGTVYKGKTTLAQLAAASLCEDAWWISLTERPTREADNLLLALARRVEHGTAPSLIIIDDLDVSQAAYRAYRPSLDLLLHRAHTSGRGVILTARGGAQHSAVVRDFKDVELIEVEAINDDELKALCVTHGCPPDLAQPWSALIVATTRGHPKLVQVRLDELMSEGWPKPRSSDLTNASPAVVSAREMARELLSETVAPSVAEFVYTIADASIPLDRSIAMALAESVPNLVNAGDIIASLAGKWLESVDNSRLRATALLQGASAQAWSQVKRQETHTRLCMAIQSKSPLSPDEAAAIVFHAYLGNASQQLALAALRLQLLKDREAVRQVNRHLQWLTWMALEPEQRITDNPYTASVLRSLQFRVAVTVESDSLPAICERWAEDIERIENAEFQSVARFMRAISIGLDPALVPLRFRLQALREIERAPPELLTSASLPKEISGQASEKATPRQAMFSCAIQLVRDLKSLEELLQWLGATATPEIRRDFESILEWPLVQTMGAFVQTAWTHRHEEIKDWTPWLTLFDEIERYATVHNSPRFGREAAKARAIVLTEYLNRPSDALASLDRAGTLFGSSPVLVEQRANVFFHTNDDMAVLEIWRELYREAPNSVALDPFAFRRAAISASRLTRWREAEEIFLAGVAAADVRSTQPTRFGLMVDAALMSASNCDYSRSACHLIDAVKTLPKEAAEEGNLRWEAALRVASEVCTYVTSRANGRQEQKGKVEAGWTSSPDLIMKKAETGQGAREVLFRATVLRLAACTCINGPDTSAELRQLLLTPYPSVRWFAAEAQLGLAFGMNAPSFIDALREFERGLLDLAASRRRGLSLLESDSDVRESHSLQPEQFLSLVIAALVCAGPHLVERLQSWSDASAREFGEKMPMTVAIQTLLEGTRGPFDALERTVRDAGQPTQLRVGAAARLLQESPPAALTLQLQLFLISAIADDVGTVQQGTWNLHVAKRFGDSWRALAEHRFQFVTPRSTVPALLSAIDELETGAGSLGKLIRAAQGAVGSSTWPSFMNRIR